MSWRAGIELLRPYVVKVSTPQGSGTGWLVSRSLTSQLCAIATAAHVIDHAHYWEEPVRLLHVASGKSVVLRHDERAVLIDDSLDSGAIVFYGPDLPLPETVLPLLEKEKYLMPGIEIGWLGFPAIERAGLCFFSGRISAYLEEASTYLVDGVAINGVSGGPAFHLVGSAGSIELMGIVSAYIPNRATGQVLPGVAVVRDATQFHDISQKFLSIDEAKQQEKILTDPPPADTSQALKTS
jgi:hypothetical protein